MASYSWISVTALFCYLFLLQAFVVAKKTKVIRSFMALLSCMLLACGGSFFMRVQLWPSVNLWHYVSLLGILLVPGVFYRFFLDFLDVKQDHGRTFWLLFFAAVYVVNLFTQVFIPTPIVQATEGGGVCFVYQYHWPIAILIVAAGYIVISCTRLFFRYCKGDAMMLKQLRPILIGLGILVAGTALSTLPIARGVPYDIISTVIFAYLVFCALYKKRLFTLSLLASPANCYVVAAMISVAAFYPFVGTLQEIFTTQLHLSESVSIMVLALLIVAVLLLLSRVVKKFLDAVFVKEEQEQNENIRRFSYAVSKTLSKDEILSDLLDMIGQMVPVEEACVCLRCEDGSYVAERSMSPLHHDPFRLKKDHPLIQFLDRHDGCVLIEDFMRSSSYRSLWESEKQMLQDKKVACVVPLKDSDELIGMVMLSAKAKGKPYTYSDFNLLTSVCSVCSLAVKNSQLYEKVYDETRKDDLTGLLNRKVFYETISEQMSQQQGRPLALVNLNVDDFKLYNQLYGNKEGDLALQRIAGILGASVEGRGTAFRLTGKEFALILPEHDAYSAKCLAQSVLEQVRKMHVSSELGNLKMLTMSCGVCAAPYMASTAQELISGADFAVYTAKRSGKNKVVVYSEVVESERQQQEEKGGSYDTYASTIYALTAAIDTKDHYTFQHSQNVANYASTLAIACGMDQKFANVAKEAGLLHDIGKIGIPEDILNKPGKLTQEEYETMKTHVENSVGIIRHLPSLDYVIPAVLSHHERYDGAGYPRGIAGEDIPLMGRILCIVDSFDAMVSKRSYKKAMSVERALDIIRTEAGKQFDPKLAEIFIALVSGGGLHMPQRDENSAS